MGIPVGDSLGNLERLQRLDLSWFERADFPRLGEENGTQEHGVVCYRGYSCAVLVRYELRLSLMHEASSRRHNDGSNAKSHPTARF